MPLQWQFVDRPGPVSTRSGGETRVLVSPQNAKATDAFLVTYTLQPGERMTEHYHPYTDEHLTVVEGEITALLENDVVACSAGQSILVRRGCRHALDNRGDVPALAVSALAPLAPSPELGHIETEPVPNPSESPPRVGGVE